MAKLLACCQEHTRQSPNGFANKPKAQLYHKQMIKKRVIFKALNNHIGHFQVISTTTTQLNSLISFSDQYLTLK